MVRPLLSSSIWGSSESLLTSPSRPSMIKLRCGVILTDAFLFFLQQLNQRVTDPHSHEVLALEYIRCAEGDRAGQSWLEWFWFPRAGLKSECFFAVGLLELYLAPQTQKGLKYRYLDVKDGSPFVG
jgi:hypothetical protein